MPSPAAMRPMPHVHGGWPPPRDRYRDQPPPPPPPRDSRLPPRPSEIPSKRPAPSSSASRSPARGPPRASVSKSSYSHHVPIPLPAKPRLSASPAVSSSSSHRRVNDRRRSPSVRTESNPPDSKPGQGTSLAESQWLYTPAELQSSPSVLDGMALEKERELRLKGTNFILQVGIALKLPQLTLSTAAVFFNRFLMRRSLVAKGGVKPLHHYEIAATSIFLATKVEETCRKMKEIVIACCRVAQKNPTLLVDEQTKDFWRWRDTILLNEDILLETICFDLTVESPHKTLYDMLKQLGAAHTKPLRSAAWSFLNDSTTTQLCLLFPSRVIAAAALYCAAKHCQFAFPDDKAGRPWWEVMHVPLRDIKRACNYMADVYIERRGGGSNADASSGNANSGDGSGGASAGAGAGAEGSGDGSGRNSIYVGLHTPEDEDNRSTKTRQQRRQSSSPTGTGSAKRTRDDGGDGEHEDEGEEAGEVVEKDKDHIDNSNKTDNRSGRNRNMNGDDDLATEDERYRKRQRTASDSGGGGGVSLLESSRAEDSRRRKQADSENGGVKISNEAGPNTHDDDIGSEDGEVEG